MKRLMCIAALGALALAAPAPAQDVRESVRISAYQIELPAKPYKMYAGDFNDYKGAYNLSNDKVLVLSQQGRRMFAEVGEAGPRELVAAAPNVFVSLDRSLKITLNQGFFGAYDGELLMRVPAGLAQANAGQVIRLAAAQ